MNRHLPGPVLPYELIAGVIPCRGRWLVASAKIHGVTFSPEDPRLLATFPEVFDEKPAFSVVAVPAPIGYLETPQPGGRGCERAARRLLGKRAGAVRPAPTRAAIDSPDDHPKVDAVTARLLPRFREVAAEMAPFRQRVAFEVHPELSFFQLNNDQPLHAPKRMIIGRAERRALLEERLPGIARILDAEIEGVTEGHLLDAGACLWTARRMFAHAGVRVPEDPEWDEEALRMELIR
jgi:predicted RNase H-like nuclease